MLTVDFQVFDGIDDFSRTAYVRFSDGRIAEFGRNNTAQWVFVQWVKQAEDVHETWAEREE